MYDSSAKDIMSELKWNILNFGYGVNFKYVGMFSHSFDWFYIVTRFELTKTKDLRLVTFKFDFECSYTNHTSTNTNYAKLLKYCMKIAPYAQLYQRQIQYYNHTAYDTLTNDIGKIMSKFLTDHRHKRGTILASILGSFASSVIGLAYEGISSFLHHKRHKALHKAVAEMDKRTIIQHNRIHHLEDTMIMYGVYNSDTLTDLIDTVHRMQNFTSWNEKTFTGKLHDWMELYTQDEGVHNYAINSILFLTTVREKYVKMYERFIEEMKLHSKAIRALSKGYLPISPLLPSKLEKNSKRSENSNCKIQQRLWSSSDKTVPILWHEIGYIWNRQPHEFDCTIPCIHATLHPEKIDYVSNWNRSCPNFGWKWTSAFTHWTKDRKAIYCIKWRNIPNVPCSRTENV